jgi:hypothetical protein
MATLLVSAATIGAAQPASAQELDNRICPGFDVTIEASGGNQREHVLTDKAGNEVLLYTGTSGSVVFTNVSDPAQTFTLRSRGTAIRITPNGDGKTETWEVSGHFVLGLFKRDDPAGPSTTLYEGRVVFTNTIADEGSDTLLSTRGKQTDICAELAT